MASCGCLDLPLGRAATAINLVRGKHKPFPSRLWDNVVVINASKFNFLNKWNKSTSVTRAILVDNALTATKCMLKRYTIG